MVFIKCGYRLTLTQFVCKTATATLFLLQVHLSDDRFSIGVTNKKYLEKNTSYNLTCQYHFLWTMNMFLQSRAFFVKFSPLQSCISVDMKQLKLG